MASISYDGQSFMIDGRRVWLVSGAIHYTRVPRALWRDRIRAARQAGLNCIETYAFWNVHEPRPGVFNFEGDADIRAFIQTIGDEGMYCILRPGPYVCAEWDLGGLPPWLLKNPEVRLREASPPFLEACARYLGALMAQVGDLQATTTAGSIAVTGKPGGPIIMVQAENEYFCDNPEQTTGYLGELVRYLRENGCSVPINDCNNLWSHVEGTIACWNARHDLVSILRQLGVVQPDAPRIVTEYWTGWFDRWGGAHDRSVSAQQHYAYMAGVLAAGGQFNQYMFHGGTNFGFWAGCNAGRRANYITTSYDYDAPLGEGGGRGEKYLATKRVSMFANHFGNLLAHLRPDVQHAAVAPEDGDRPLSVIHQHGSQGDVVFVFRGAGDNTRATTLLLPNGLKLQVPLGDDPVAWLVLNASLGGAATLSFTSLRPWALIDRQMLVLFGPAGADGLVAINDAPLHVKVPTGRTPVVQRHEGVTIVVLNTEQVDASFVRGDSLVIGAWGLDDKDQPIGLDGWKTRVVDLDGRIQSVTASAPAKPGRTPALSGWQTADTAEFVDGSAASFKPIDGPASLEKLGVNFGYGWYRIRGAASARGDVLFPQAGDRLHVYRDGNLAALLGEAPGATADPTAVKLDDVTILADNLGRLCSGYRMHEQRGIFGHAYAVKRVALGRPKVVDGPAPDLFAWRGFVPLARRSHRPPSQALVWKFKSPNRTATLILEIADLPGQCLVQVNGQIVGAYHMRASAEFSRWVIDPAVLKGGQNELRLAFVGSLDKSAKPATQVRLYQGTNLTTKAEWAFARWEQPAAERFAPLPRTLTGSVPRWFRSTFSVARADVPLWLEPRGMSKGQVYLNGHNVGRYFVATADGKAVPPQSRYYLPEPWLHTDKPNELILFDEHGKHPGKCRLVYDANGPYG